MTTYEMSASALVLAVWLIYCVVGLPFYDVEGELVFALIEYLTLVKLPSIEDGPTALA